MKKIAMFSVVALMAGQVFSQQFAIANAFEYLSTYKLEKDAGNEQASIDALLSAKKEIDPVTTNAQTSGMSKAWSRKGEVYYYIATDKSTRLTLVKEGAIDTAIYCLSKSVTVEKKENGKPNIPDKDNVLTMLSTLGNQVVTEGNAAVEANDYKGAIVNFEKGKTIFEAMQVVDPKNADIQRAVQGCIDGIAIAAGNSGSVDMIIKYIEPMVYSSTAPLWAYPMLSQVYIDKQDYNKAGEIVSKGKVKYADSSAIVLADLTLAFAQGDNDRAGKLIEDAKVKFPKEKTKFILQEVNYLVTKGDNEKAIVALDEAIATFKDDKDIAKILYFNSGVIYDQMANKDSLKRNEYRDKALSYYNIVAEMDPNYDAVYNQIGNYYVTKGNEFLDAANALPISKDKEYKDLKAKANVEYTKATEYLEKAYKLRKADTYKNNLLILYERTQQYDKIDALQKEQ